MRNRLHLVTAILCLLTLFLGTATCIAAQLPHHTQTMQSSCGNCPKNAPAPQQTSLCCNVSQQPTAASAAFELERPSLSVHPIAADQTPLLVSPIATSHLSLAATPPLPTLIALRI